LPVRARRPRPYRGRVSDQSGSPVPRATVEAVQDGTGLKFSSTANEAGSYEILYLAPGTYSLALHAQGFETVKQAGSDRRFEQGVLVDERSAGNPQSRDCGRGGRLR